MLAAPLLLIALLRATAPHDAATVRVAVDSVRRRVIITAGPFDIPAMAAGMPDMPGMDHDAGHLDSDLFRFDWPVVGYLRGFDVALLDAGGAALSRSVLHHLIAVNLDRRQLVYPALERTFGWGAETDKVDLPAGVGVPLARGARLGFYVAWHNDTRRPMTGVFLRIILPYDPPQQLRVAVLPFYVDVRNVIGGVTTFDLPIGHSEQSYEFTVPLSGRLIAAGGHVHDFGTSVRLEDAETGKVLVRLKATHDTAGRVLSVSRFIWGFHDDALPLLAGHRYRVVSVYDNTSGHPLHAGGMGHINGAFEPSDLAAWPRLDPADPELKRDIATLPPQSDQGPSPR